MDQRELENNIKEKFSGFRSDYKASESMWDNIETQLPIRKNNRKWILISSCICIFLLSISTIYFSNNVNAVTQSNSIIDITPTLPAHTNEMSAISDGEITEVSNAGSFQKAEKSSAVRQEQLNNNWVLNDNSGQSSLVSIDKVPAQLRDPSANNRLNATDKAATRVATTQTLTSSHTGYDKSVNSLLAQLSSLPSVAQEDIKQSIERPVPSVLDSLLPSVLENIEESKISIGMIIGSNLVSSSYYLNDKTYNSVLEERKRSESNKQQYQLGIELDYELTTHWSITSGFGLSFFQDELFQESNSTRYDTLLNYSEPTSGEDTVLVGTAIRETRTNTQSWNYTDRFAISLPVVINYKTAIGSKSKVGIGLGIEKIFYSDVKGVELDKNNELYDLTLDSENRYSTRGANALLRLHYNYNITNNWDLRLMMNYKHALRSNYNSSAPIDKSFNTIGIAIGSFIKL